jgi:hypothetical protein
MSARWISNANYFLASRLRNDILEAIKLNHIYEKIRFVINHTPDWHCVCGFLHATAGDNCNFDYSGNSRFAVAIAGKEEEDHGQEKGQDRSVAFAG